MNTEICVSQYPIFKPIFTQYETKRKINGKEYTRDVFAMKAFKPAEKFFNEHPDQWPLFLNDLKNCSNLNHKATCLMSYMKISRSGARNWIEDRCL